MLKVGDMLTISKNSSLFIDKHSWSGSSTTRITCLSDHLFESVQLGDPIAFDDGSIWGEVKDKNSDELLVEITNASPDGSRLGCNKSINIPKSATRFKGLTSKDLVDLEFVSANADMVGISFLRDVEDMIAVRREVENRKLGNLGVILKIETEDAFRKLPQLLFQAMQLKNPLGVMVARGDLMVECGWDQMAGVQEEIISTCNAAHIPVIWATQVLESLVKFGYPTRAEITDAARAMKTSCVMLNKGEHVAEVVSALRTIFCNAPKENKNCLKLH